jgi:raffinose synthase
VLSGLSSFIETKITPRFIILDDGWQGTDVDDQPNGKQWGGRLRSFRANFKFHPEYRVTEAHAKIHQEDIEGNSEVEINVEVESVANTIPFNYQDTHSLSNLIQQTKERYGIKYFMVWHSLLGYWAGVQPSSEDSSLNDNAVSDEMSMFQSKITFPYLPSSMYRMSRADALASEPFSTRGVGLPDHRLADQFYDSYHSTLREMNVDGVKVDAQSIISSLTDDRYNLMNS